MKTVEAIGKAAHKSTFIRFGKNSMDSPSAFKYEIGFKEGALSNSAKEHWQQGMYTEEQVKLLCLRAMKDVFKYVNGKIDDIDPVVWFDVNKKLL